MVAIAPYLTGPKRLAAACASLLWLSQASAPGFAQARDCISEFYRDPSAACLSEIARTLDGRPEASLATFAKNDWSFLGFFAGLAVAHPEYEKTLVALEAAPHTKFLIVNGLCLSGRRDAAQSLAAAAGLKSPQCAERPANAPSPLLSLRPGGTPGINDELIGAYFASGDAAYLQNILRNFEGMEPSATADALRYGLYISKFGHDPKFAEHSRAMGTALCAKYDCKANPAPMMRVLTLATGYWALSSIAARDKTVAATVKSYFDEDKGLSSIQASEVNAFSNYVTHMIVVVAGIKNQAIEDAVSDFETFKPAAEIRFPGAGPAK